MKLFFATILSLGFFAGTALAKPRVERACVLSQTEIHCSSRSNILRVDATCGATVRFGYTDDSFANEKVWGDETLALPDLVGWTLIPIYKMRAESTAKEIAERRLEDVGLMPKCQPETLKTQKEE